MKIRTKVWSFRTYYSECGSEFFELTIIAGKTFSRERRNWEDWDEPFRPDNSRKWELIESFGDNRWINEFTVYRTRKGFSGCSPDYLTWEYVDVMLPENGIRVF